jgi:hypothetical protein
MLAWYVNRVAVIVIAVVVIALAGTQLPALARVLAERHYGREASARTRPGNKPEGPGRSGHDDAGEVSTDGRDRVENDASDERARRDEGDDGPAPMQRSG